MTVPNKAFFGMIPFVTLDVFTTTPFQGNPLAIIRVPAALRHTLTTAQKQLIAREFNLSECVFLHEQADRYKPEWHIDIFTTNDELPFAGHPTIGAACYVLGAQNASGGTFITKAGRIPIMMTAEEGRVMAEIPSNVHVHQHTLGDLVGPTVGLSEAPRLQEAELRAPIVSIVKGMTFLLVQLETLEDLGRVENTSSELSFRGVLDPGGWANSFVARYYYVILPAVPVFGNGNGNLGGGGPEKGVMQIRTRMLEEAMEDPATGSAACALGSYIALQARRTMRFEVVQGVEMGRKSVMGVDVYIDREGRAVESVRLSGSAVAVMEGSLRV